MDEPVKEEKGLSAHQLILMFLAVVAVCAVFFSAGFLVGYNERSRNSVPVTERVTKSPIVPPLVNPSAGPSRSGSAEKETTVTAENPSAISPEPLSVPPLPPPRRGKPGKEMPAEAPAASTKHAGALGAEPGEQFNIQVAASNTELEAIKIVQTLKARGYPAFIVPPQISHAGDNLYRVQVGPYSMRDEAEKVRARLAQDGFKEPFIKH